MPFIKNFTHGTLVISDGTTPTAISLTLDCDNGDLSITGLAETQNEVAAYECRGDLISIAHTNRTYPTFTLTAKMAEFTLASGGTVADALLKISGGAFAAAVSTSANTDVYTVDLLLTVEGTDFGDASDHTATITDAHCTVDFSEGDPNQFSISGTVYGSVTFA